MIPSALRSRLNLLSFVLKEDLFDGVVLSVLVEKLVQLASPNFSEEKVVDLSFPGEPDLLRICLTLDAAEQYLRVQSFTRFS